MTADGASPAGLITYQELLALAYRRRWWILVPLGIGIMAAIAAAVVLRPQYRSTATLLIASQEVPTALVASPLTNYADERIAKIRQQILSRANLVQLIDEMKLYPRESAQLSAEDVQNLMRGAISVELVGTGGPSASRGTGTTIAFSLSFSYYDPVTARAVTERLTRMFLDEDKRLRTEQASGTAQFLSRRGNELQDRLIELENRRRDIEARYSGALPDQVALSTQSASALRAEVSRIDAETQGLVQQNGILAARSEDLAAAPSPEAESLRRVQERLTQLTAVYTDQHPDVVAARAAVANQLADLNAYATPRLGAGVIASEIAAGRARVGTLGLRRAELVNAISQMEHLTALAPQASYELNNLERDYDNLKLQYQDIREKQMEAQVAANLQAEDKGERFTVVDPASLPIEPVFPDRMKLLTTGASAGLALGLALVLALELPAGIVHGEGAIVRILGAPPLAVVSVLRTDPEYLLPAQRLSLPRWLHREDGHGDGN